jgi:hypothetical protein
MFTLEAAQPSIAQAGKRSGARKKAKKRCKRQATRCEALFVERCAGNPDCLDKSRECCPPAGICDVDGFLSCIFGILVIGSV